jgi:hypothetical protein
VKTVSRILLRAALLLLPRKRRDWGDAILAELEETSGGLESLRWGLGGLKVIVLSPEGLARLAALGVLVGVAGGTFGNHEVFMQVRDAGYDSWLPALAFALPSAVAGVLAAWLVLRRHPLAVHAALAFLALVCVSSAISIANVPPVRPFLDDWQVAVATSDPRAAHHAEERRWNSAIGALGAALVLIVAARRQAARRAGG